MAFRDHHECRRADEAAQIENNRLQAQVAAQPDLIAALRGLQRVQDCWCSHDWSDGKHEERCKVARAALRKAGAK